MMLVIFPGRYIYSPRPHSLVPYMFAAGLNKHKHKHINIVSVELITYNLQSHHKKILKIKFSHPLSTLPVCQLH